MLEFFDYFLIGFVLAFVVGPWKLTFLQSAIVLLSSGIGAIFGAYFWGWMADKIGRRPVFNLTILNFSLATGALYFTPDGGWIYLALMRSVVGLDCPAMNGEKSVSSLQGRRFVHERTNPAAVLLRQMTGK